MTIFVENKVQEKINGSINLFIFFYGDSYDFFCNVVNCVEGFKIVPGFLVT